MTLTLKTLLSSHFINKSEAKKWKLGPIRKVKTAPGMLGFFLFNLFETRSYAAQAALRLTM